MKEVSISDIRKRFSAHLDEVAAGSPVVITRRGKPMAALVGMEDLETFNRAPRNQGLCTIVGKWEGFEEIEEHVMHAFKSRQKPNRS